MNLSEVNVPARVVFVRVITDAERQDWVPDETETVYQIVNWDNEVILTVCGSAEQAFVAAWEAGFVACWMH